MNEFTLSSAAFADGEEIPAKYTCKGQNVSPPLSFQNVPTETETLALIMHDPDAPNGDFLHWTIWNISSGERELPEGTAPDAATEGATGFGRTGYGGPCPPSSTHRYVFEAYALDEQLDLEAGSSREDLLEAIEGHVLAQTTLTGTFGAD